MHVELSAGRYRHIQPPPGEPRRSTENQLGGENLYLEVVGLNSAEEVFFAELVEDVRGDDLAELLTEEVHGLPVDPLGAVRLGAPLQDRDQRVQGQTFHDDVLASYEGKRTREEGFSPVITLNTKAVIKKGLG